MKQQRDSWEAVSYLLMGLLIAFSVYTYTSEKIRLAREAAHNPGYGADR